MSYYSLGPLSDRQAFLLVLTLLDISIAKLGGSLRLDPSMGYGDVPMLEFAVEDGEVVIRRSTSDQVANLSGIGINIGSQAEQEIADRFFRAAINNSMQSP